MIFVYHYTPLIHSVECKLNTRHTLQRQVVGPLAGQGLDGYMRYRLSVTENANNEWNATAANQT